MKTPTDVNLAADSLSSLSPPQRAQIIRQIEYHLKAPPYEEIKLSDVVFLRTHICSGVTRPMSSKGLAQWLWRSPDLYFRKRVLDMGTGCGVQGITCMLRGAEFVLLSDVTAEAARCAQDNLNASGLGARGKVQVSDLFESLRTEDAFDLIVFAQPYFEGTPLPQFPFTRGMLARGDLLNGFFQKARGFLRPGGHLVLMGWSFAGKANDPGVAGPKFGFTQIRRDLYRDESGVQHGEFHVVLFS